VVPLDDYVCLSALTGWYGVGGVDFLEVLHLAVPVLDLEVAAYVFLDIEVADLVSLGIRVELDTSLLFVLVKSYCKPLVIAQFDYYRSLVTFERFFD
jgi:hypothetical protein